jgi:hypothetical protein
MRVRSRPDSGSDNLTGKACAVIVSRLRPKRPNGRQPRQPTTSTQHACRPRARALVFESRFAMALETGVDEQEALNRLPAQLRLISMLEERAEARPFWDLARPQSALARDDAALRPYQLSHLVGHCLASSIDALRTARLIMQVSEHSSKLRLPMMGLYPIVRAATESGALAVWLLQSDEPKERLTRGLMARYADVIHDDRARQLLLSEQPGEDGPATSRRMRGLRENTKSVRSVKAKLREIGERNQVNFDVYRKGIPGFGPIVGAASASVGLPSGTTRVTWHMLSGLSHPSASRSMMMSELTSFGEKEDVVRAKFTARPSVVGLGLDSGTTMLITALRLTAERGGDKSLEVPLAPSR